MDGPNPYARVISACGLCHERQAVSLVDGYPGGLCVACVASEVQRIHGTRAFAAVADFVSNVTRRASTDGEACLGSER